MGFFIPKKKAKPSVSIKAATKHNPPKVKAVEYPCPGISDANDVQISKYLSHTQVLRAGSVSLQKIVKEIHGINVRYVKLRRNGWKMSMSFVKHGETYTSERRYLVVHQQKTFAFGFIWLHLIAFDQFSNNSKQ